MKKSSKKTVPVEIEETFTRRTYNRGKSLVIKHGATGLIALLISSVVPMLEQWHSDALQAAEIASVKADCQKDIDELKADQKDKIDALWKVMGTKKDK